MPAGFARLLRGGDYESRVAHAERIKNVPAEISIQRLAAGVFHQAADPIDAPRILPARPRVENQQRSWQVLPLFGRNSRERLAILHRLGIPQAVSETGCMGQKLAQQD